MDDRKKMIRAANQRSKKYIIQRINEILDDYLMDDKEDFCRIDMEFRKGKETQEKHLLWERITE